MYDAFKPMKILEFFPFSFDSNRFEIWMKGKKVEEGAVSTKIRAIPFEDFNDEDKIEVTIHSNTNDYLFRNVLTAKNNFRNILTSTDRLILATIPPSSINDCDGLGVFRATLGTNVSKPLLKLEPYSCCLFYINGVLSKVTFTVNFPETLIEFY